MNYIFNGGDILIGDDGNTYKIIADKKGAPCTRCCFHQHKKINGLKCSQLIENTFRREIYKRDPNNELFYCDMIIGENTYNGAHFENITAHNRIASWKKIIKGV